MTMKSKKLFRRFLLAPELSSMIPTESTKITTTTIMMMTSTRSLSYIPMAPPPLFDLCVRRSFDEALERVRTHPHEARFKHPRNWTALHCCVEHVAPLPVVKAIYEAHPDSLTTKDWQGITPQEAAVDLETKEFLKQQLEELQVRQQQQQQDSNVATQNDDEKNSTQILRVRTNNDPMLLGKIMGHANILAEQVSDLNVKTEEMQKEIEELKETLRAMSGK